MILKNIDGALLKEMVINGTMLLESHKDEINALNVFPVPDGDTGTNMSFTMKGAITEINKVEINGVDTMAEALSRGSLKGARGNSGVILSQVFRGFYNGVKDQPLADATTFANAMQDGVTTAYKAVMKPREGTILTVSRAVADACQEKAKECDNIIEVMQYGIDEGQAMLLRTPDMLDVLKKAGVVDAGGEGLLMIYKGYIAAMRGEEPVRDVTYLNAGISLDDFSPIVDSLEEITFGYCTEFFIIDVFDNVGNEDIEILKHQLDKIGDSIVVVGDSDLIKVHVHSDTPNKVLGYAMRLGSLDKIKIDNMREQQKEIQSRKTPPKKNGIVAVTAGEGLASIFKDLGVDIVVEGGQTMNPSTEDIAKAIQDVNAENVYVLPNNSNIIMAAQQAEHIITNCNVFVIPSKSTPEGITAMLSYNEDGGEGMFEEMTDVLGDVMTGQITYAVRDSSYDDLTISKGDIMGLINGKISLIGQDINKIGVDLVSKMCELNDEIEIITIYKGEDISQSDAQALCEVISNENEDCDVDVQVGGQPLYYYIISAE